MTDCTGYQHPLKFLPGKDPPTIDRRTITLKSILNRKALPPAPETADVDLQLGGIIDNAMWLNDELGDCVVADYAAFLLRNEKYEQGICLNIPDADVRAEYFEQTGGVDSGLNMLAYLNHLRKDGIKVGGKVYKIHAFASVNYLSHEEVRLAINHLHGVYVGMQVPQSMIDQFNACQMFDVVDDDGGIQGGHCIYGPAYVKYRIENITAVGPVIRTWAKRFQATWAFWDKYVDECYVIIDERDTWIDPEHNPLDIPALEALLKDITNTEPDPDPVPPDPGPTPEPPRPGCLLGHLKWMIGR